MLAVGYLGGVRPPCLHPPALLESRYRGEGDGGLDRLEHGWVDAHAHLGVERKVAISRGAWLARDPWIIHPALLCCRRSTSSASSNRGGPLLARNSASFGAVTMMNYEASSRDASSDDSSLMAKNNKRTKSLAQPVPSAPTSEASGKNLINEQNPVKRAKSQQTLRDL